jgi:hypothetical protein
MTTPSPNSGQQINIGGSVTGSGNQFIAAHTAHGNTNTGRSGSGEDALAEAKRQLDAIRTAAASASDSPEHSDQALNAVAVVERELSSQTPDQGKVKAALARLQDLTLTLTSLATAVTGLGAAVSRLFAQH